MFDLCMLFIMCLSKLLPFMRVAQSADGKTQESNGHTCVGTVWSGMCDLMMQSNAPDCSALAS